MLFASKLAHSMDSGFEREGEGPVFQWSFQVTIFIESTLRDVFLHKVGAVTYFSALKKSCFLKSVLLVNF